MTDTGRWLKINTTMHFFDTGEREAICKKGFQRVEASAYTTKTLCRECRIAKHNREDHPTTLVYNTDKKVIEIPRRIPT
jgi:hypothetical protein